MKLLFRNNLRPILTAILVFLGATGLLGVIIESRESKLTQAERVQATRYLGGLRARLESSLNASIYLIQAFDALIERQDHLTQDDFDAIAMALVGHNPQIRNVGLAEGYVITRVYPLRGNEGALGLDYRKNTEQWPAVQRAVREHQTLVAGPLKLVQGGIGVITRMPIYLPDPEAPAGEKFWGIASIVMDFETILEAAGLPDPDASYLVAIRGRDGLGAEGEVFWGDPGLFARDPAIMEVSLPNGSWQIAAYPVHGWTPGSEALWLRGGAALIALLLSSLALVVVRDSQRLRHLALHDPLTGLPNRHLFNRRVEQAIAQARRHRRKLALAVLDLNRFKPVNDRFGHLAGDYVLQEVALRVESRIRLEDTLARTGGDEFTLLLVEIGDSRDAVTVAENLAEAIRQPFYWRSQEITIAVSIGIAIYPDHGKDMEALFQHADQAMYQAKGTSSRDWKMADNA